MTVAVAVRHPAWRDWSGRLLAFGLASPLLLIGIALLVSWSVPTADIWAHLRAYVLVEVTLNTLLLLLAVGVGVSVIGVGMGWLSAHCEYPGRRVLDWALVLPLAMPTYVVAFAWVGVLDYAAPLQTAWRALSGSTAALFDGRGLLGAGLLLSLVLYPYVFVLARAAFLRQGAAGFDAARSLGHAPLAAFFRVALPLIRPAWIAGLTLALLETLADFGAVSILGVDTLTTAVYKTWFGQLSLPAAAQLASLLLLAVMAVLLVERVLRGGGVQHERSLRAMPRLPLSGGRGWLASVVASLVVALGFAVPMLQLLISMSGIGIAIDGAALARAAGNTLLLAVLVTLGVLLAAGVLVALVRSRPRDVWHRGAEFIATLGYAVPGTVLAVAVMALLITTEQALNRVFVQDWVLVGSVLGLLLALIVRFLRVGHGALDAAAAQLRPSQLETARLLGASRYARWRWIVWPQLAPSLLGGALLVLVETMKEMPATLMLRPFGWDTLAVRIYAQTAEGLWAQAAAPGLLLVLVGFVPVWWLMRSQR